MTRFEELKLKAEQRLSEEAYIEVAKESVNDRSRHHSHVYALPLGYKDSLAYWLRYHS